MKKLLFFLLVLKLSTDCMAQNSFKESSTMLTSWMDLHCRILRNANGIAHVAYSRHFSYTAIAAYESIVQSSNHRSLSGQLIGLTTLPKAPGMLIPEASLNAAYAEMLRKFYASFGSCKVAIDSMEKVQKLKFVTHGARSSAIETSEVYGKNVASSIIKWANEDLSENTKKYIAQQGEGIWVPTQHAAAPFWGDNRSLTKNLSKAFIFKSPVYSADTAKAFYKMAEEVYTITKQLSREQKATALYWDDSPNGEYMTAFGHWSNILSGLIKKHQLSLITATEAYARLTIAMHEASILAWKGKYKHKVVRPITYIQKYLDKSWTPLIPTPPHPEFPAAHATLSTAAAVALASVFGDSCSVTDNSYVSIGMKERTFASLQEVAKEAGLSRLYGGIHYRYSIDEGARLGAATAKHVEKAIRFR